ncbi:MAG: family 43 glycosylhydrolase [Terracidiphilus sp.]|nr:family 43 glycosylhydrolase [Terracidiphilus sp.]MDR3776373.1 family 43 glycosylhydrolase [Terracidiphilus sp.]
MKLPSPRFVLSFAVLLLPIALFAAPPVLRPGEPWLDDRGQQIQAHGGGILQWHGAYYWFGEDRTQSNDPAKRYVACYSSLDLAHWKFRGQVVALSDPESLGANWVFERPKVFHNPRTGKFVMYVHLDDGKYKLARVAVLVSDTVDGNYKYVKSFRPLDQESRDIGQFVDDDGSAYLIFESRPTKGFFIAQLSADYLSVEKQVSFVPAPLEGGAVVHYKGLYYVIGSHLTGWGPNPNVYATAPSLSGPWTEFKDIAPPETKTYGSQSSMLVKVTGSRKTTVIFIGDIWRPKTLWDSRYLWMPLEIGDGSLRLPPPHDWTLNIKTGETALVP